VRFRRSPKPARRVDRRSFRPLSVAIAESNRRKT
jgi:hypothetical protein